MPNDDRSEIVESEGHDPDRDALVPVHEPGDHEQERADDRGRGEAHECTPSIGVVTADDGRKDEVQQANEQVRAAEEHGVVAEGARHGEGGAEHRAHRTENRQPYATFVDVRRTRQPGVGNPRPPERGEHEQPAQHPTPRRVMREQARDLRDREHEDQVEEELERRDLMLGVGHAVGVGHARIMHEDPARFAITTRP